MSENEEPIFSVLNGKVDACAAGGTGYCDCELITEADYYTVGYYVHEDWQVNTTVCCPVGYTFEGSLSYNGSSTDGRCYQTPGVSAGSVGTWDIYCQWSNGQCGNTS